MYNSPEQKQLFERNVCIKYNKSSQARMQHLLYGAFCTNIRSNIFSCKEKTNLVLLQTPHLAHSLLGSIQHLAKKGRTLFYIYKKQDNLTEH